MVGMLVYRKQTKLGMFAWLGVWTDVLESQFLADMIFVHEETDNLYYLHNLTGDGFNLWHH